MDYSFLNLFSKAELEEFIQTLNNKEELANLKQEVARRSTIMATLDDSSCFLEGEFSSERMLHYDKTNEKKVEKFLAGMIVGDLHFVRLTFINDKLIGRYGGLTLLDADRQLSSNNSCYEHEDSYNLINFIKEYFYRCLENNPDVTLDDIYTEFLEKREIVIPKLKDISNYLYYARGNTGLRLSVGNAGLKRNTTKTSETLSYSQRAFVDAVAFGCDKEKIITGNYEDSKRLLYLPRKNIKR